MNTEFKCQEMIEVVTNYLDDALPPDEQQRFERHLSYCAGCNTYVDQIRETIRQTGMVPHESLPPALREKIVAQFRNWKPS
jgi:anti-sigma factor (TIGR02949 family)